MCIVHNSRYRSNSTQKRGKLGGKNHNDMQPGDYGNDHTECVGGNTERVRKREEERKPSPVIWTRPGETLRAHSPVLHPTTDRQPTRVEVVCKKEKEITTIARAISEATGMEKEQWNASLSMGE